MKILNTLAFPLLALTLSMPAFAAFELDFDHTNAGFRVKHMMVSSVRGEFTEVGGDVKYDPKAPLKTKIDVTVGVKSVDTRNDKRDAHLRSPDFFDAENHPNMHFVSKKIVKAKGKNRYKIIGDLTIRGVTKEVELAATLTPPTRSPWGTTVVGVRAEGQIDRRDFGLTWNKALEKGGVVVGHDVNLEIDAELVHKGEWVKS